MKKQEDKLKYSTKDSLVNVMTGKGTKRDKSTADEWTLDGYDKSLLTSLFSSSWLARRIVMVPADESTKKWRNIETPSMTPEQHKEFTKMEKKLKVRKTNRTALLWSRLYGGGGIYVAIDGDDPSEPLDIEKIQQGTTVNFIPMDRNEVTPKKDSIIDDEFSTDFGKPEFYRFNATRVDVHCSRFLRFDGIDVPRELRERNSSWGVSVFDSTLIEQIGRCESILSSLSTLLKQSNIDVVSVPDLFRKLSNANTLATLRKRFAEGELIKEAYGTMLLDAKEEFTRHELGSISGAVTFISSYFQIPSAATGIPVTKLMGTSPGGLNATGESDLENYYGQCEDVQEGDMTDALQVMDAIICQVTFGRQFDDWEYSWESLWSTDKKEESEISKNRTEELRSLNEAGLLSPGIVVRQLHEDGRFSAITEEYVGDIEGLEEDDDDLDRELEGNEETTEETTEEPKTDTTAEPSEDIQKEALNGAQVSSLLQIAQLVKQGTIEKEQAGAIIQASFPTLEDVDAIINVEVEETKTVPEENTEELDKELEDEDDEENTEELDKELEDAA